MANDERTRHPAVFVLLAAFIMAYGWGYRGTVGHEAGAMVPGAMLGLVLCLGSGRLDWFRRTAVAGLLAAIGWAWGGSFSYMEQTLYALSDSFPDVLYGYTMLFFLGGLWAGIGGGALGLAFTESRSELERLLRPFVAVCAVFFLVHLYFFFMPEHREAYATITVVHFHNGDWLSATLTLAVSSMYWLLRPADRKAAALWVCGAAAWWVGYLAFTKFGGIRLAPLHRSESWGGVVGVLAVLMVYLYKSQNRAALMLSLYGILGGGLAFAFAVFLRHPLAVQWGPFELPWGEFKGHWPQWRFAEDCYGFFMGLAIALGAHRLLRGKLQPPEEDKDRAPLDVFAVFVILVALLWINFRRHAAPSLATSNASNAAPLFGIPLWPWYVFAGALPTSALVYGLYRYLKGDRQLVPPTAFGKGATVTLLLVWVTVAGYTFHVTPSAAGILGPLLLWAPAGIATWLLLSYVPLAPLATAPAGATKPPSSPVWNVGRRYALLWGVTPMFLLSITGLSLAMQDGPLEGMGRKRFGPHAYWQQTARLMGTWEAVGAARRVGDDEIDREDRPVTRLRFDEFRNVAATLPPGETVSVHRWFLKNQYTWLQWYSREPEHPEYAEVPIQFHEQRIYIAWPPHAPAGRHLVFERTGD
jgi:hypothetical protein